MISASLLRSGGFSSSSLVVDVGVGGAGVFLPLVPPPTDCDLSQPTSEGSGRGRPGGRPLGGPRLNFILREEKEGDEKRVRTRWSGRRATLPPSALRPPPSALRPGVLPSCYKHCPSFFLVFFPFLFCSFFPRNARCFLPLVLLLQAAPEETDCGLNLASASLVPSLYGRNEGEKVARARKKGSKNIFRALPIGGQKVRGRTGGKEGVTGDEGKGGKKEQPKEEKAIYALRMNRTAGCRRRLLLSSCGGGGWRSPGS